MPAAIFGTLIVQNLLQTGPDDTVAIGVEMVAALLPGVVQGVRRHREPVNRAGLRWFILASLTGCSLFIFLVVAPLALGLPQIGIIGWGIAFAFFNVMHVGLALGVLRYKIFNLDRWSYYLWVWLSGMLLLALDKAIRQLLFAQASVPPVQHACQ